MARHLPAYTLLTGHSRFTTENRQERAERRFKCKALLDSWISITFEGSWTSPAHSNTHVGKPLNLTWSTHSLSKLMLFIPLVTTICTLSAKGIA